VAWTTPRTWVAGELITAAMMNTHVRDNFVALDSPPAARVYHSSGQVITTSTETALNFDSERFDTDTIHDNATANTRLTCRTAGRYMITTSIGWDANATGIRYCLLRLNGTTYIARDVATLGHATVNTTHTLAAPYDLAVNDYVEVAVMQTSGGNLGIAYLGNYSPTFAMCKL
jgi:hypothetical protein